MKLAERETQLSVCPRSLMRALRSGPWDRGRVLGVPLGVLVLTLVGFFGSRSPATPTPSSSVSRAGFRAVVPSEPGAGTLRGHVSWQDPNGDEKPMSNRQLFLKGVEGRVLNKLYEVRIDHAGHYRFSGVTPGHYLLTNRILGSPTWRLKVLVETGSARAVDLSQENSLRSRDDFPRG